MHVIGTAGHVDHGKSTLVEALTGIDPDRLAEEKAREMTIDLGFAWLTLDGEEVGVVDVPGHRDFIENMLAGVGGIDLALFVIAADEGVMPQTREHLAILDLLEIERGIVALTKSDMVDDPDWLDLVTLEVAEALHGTTLAEAPIIPVSARTGAGLQELKNALAAALNSIGQPPDWGKPRLPIDRIFSLSGFGTVVTGTLLDGSLRIGDEIDIQPGSMVGRIRGLQTHKTKIDIAYPGSRVAVNLVGIDRDELHRGQVVASRGLLRETRLVDVFYRHLDNADSPLLHNAEIKFFVGAAEVTARARIIGQEEISPGQEGWIQFALNEPIATTRGDRFIVRRPSPGATLGGGRVLDPHPGRRHRRFREDVIARYKALTDGSADELLLNTLSRLGPLQQSILIEKAGLNAEDAQTSLQTLIADGQIIGIGKLLIASSTWNSLLDRAIETLKAFHREAPLRAGIEREQLRGRLHISPPVFNVLLQSLTETGHIIETGTLLRLPTHQVTFTVAQQASIAELMAQFESQGLLSPSVKECKAMVGESIYFALVDLGRIKPITEDVVYAAPLYDHLIAKLTDHLHQKGSISAPEARDLLGASRKYAIALLEHMDELRITRRNGDVRLPARPLKG